MGICQCKCLGGGFVKPAKRRKITQGQLRGIVGGYKKVTGNHSPVSRETFVQLLDGVLPPFLALEIFDSFDRNKTQEIDLRECLISIALDTGTPEEKMAASFEIYDADSDDKLTREETTAMMAMVKVVNRVPTDATRAVTQIFEKADPTNSGHITKEAYLAAANLVSEFFK
eukprot:TRINITY_DN2541_c0_g1_i2.p1 TRINITY_DN2541_c0_g1~~TRINITY_DN2541_c0_g1_i2.p1  ORF type:complete len:171 (+),score=49.25 TRINITY_DN2541_c0_g1_i2:34-546(+)